MVTAREREREREKREEKRRERQREKGREVELVLNIDSGEQYLYTGYRVARLGRLINAAVDASRCKTSDALSVVREPH